MLLSMTHQQNPYCGRGAQADYLPAKGFSLTGQYGQNNNGNSAMCSIKYAFLD